jgi:hypothetical protein
MIDAREAYPAWLLHAVTVVLMLLGIAITTTPAQAQKSYEFTAIAFLGDPAPGGDFFITDFEPRGINSRGDVAFNADVVPGEGVFLATRGGIIQTLRSGDAAPGGGTVDAFGAWNASLNQNGDVSVAFQLSPFLSPIGTNAGIYRFDADSSTVSAVMTPGVTPAPGGGFFQGSSALRSTVINNSGTVLFDGMIPTADGIHIQGEPYIGLGVGIFQADKKGAISSVVSPGDPAPGGGTFDFAANGYVNSGGDVAFGAHIVSDPCNTGNPPVPQTGIIRCFESVYVKKKGTGEITSIAHQGDPAPGGGTYRLAFGPVINSRGDIVFIGDLTPAPDFLKDMGVFLNVGGLTVPIARPGDPMPGGGNLATAAPPDGRITNYNLNNRGDVSFHGFLDTGEDGIYVSSHGTSSLVAKTGSVLPGIGTIAQLSPTNVWGNGLNNNRGQVLFWGTLTDGRIGMFVATPTP